MRVLKATRLDDHLEGDIRILADDPFDRLDLLPHEACRTIVCGAGGDVPVVEHPIDLLRAIGDRLERLLALVRKVIRAFEEGDDGAGTNSGPAQQLGDEAHELRADADRCDVPDTRFRAGQADVVLRGVGREDRVIDHAHEVADREAGQRRREGARRISERQDGCSQRTPVAEGARQNRVTNF